MSVHFISLEKAKILNERFRNKREEILDAEYKGKDVLPFSETFSRDAIDAILNQVGCKAIRFYMGMEEDDKLILVAVGVNDADEDMLPESEDAVVIEENKIVENGYRCPTTCPPPSVLNQN
jgi:hypothetical protein